MTYVYWKSSLNYSAANAGAFTVTGITLGINEDVSNTTDITLVTTPVNNVPDFDPGSIGIFLFSALQVVVPSAINSGFSFDGQSYDTIYNPIFLSQNPNFDLYNAIFAAHASSPNITAFFQIRDNFGQEGYSQIFEKVADENLSPSPEPTLSYDFSFDDAIYAVSYDGVKSKLIRRKIAKPYNEDYNNTIRDTASSPLANVLGTRSQIHTTWNDQVYTTYDFDGTQFGIAEWSKTGGTYTGNQQVITVSGATTNAGSASCRKGNNLIIFFDERVFEFGGTASELTFPATQIGTLAGYWFRDVYYFADEDLYFATGGTGANVPSSYTTLDIFSISSDFLTITNLGTVGAYKGTNRGVVRLTNSFYLAFAGVTAEKLLNMSTKTLDDFDTIIDTPPAVVSPTSLITGVSNPTGISDFNFMVVKTGVSLGTFSGATYLFLIITPTQ